MYGFCLAGSLDILSNIIRSLRFIYFIFIERKMFYIHFLISRFVSLQNVSQKKK